MVFVESLAFNDQFDPFVHLGWFILVALAQDLTRNAEKEFNTTLGLAYDESVLNVFVFSKCLWLRGFLNVTLIDILSLQMDLKTLLG